MKRGVHVNADEIASVADVMCLIERLPYLKLLEFAGLTGGDADKIADAANLYFGKDEVSND